MPAIMILGFDLEITRVMLVAVLGGLLGILMMIPLRRALIVQQHGMLKYPEGTACAEVLKAGASAESRAAASPAAKRRAGAGRRRGHERQDHLHRLRHRPRLQDAECRASRAGRTCPRRSSAPPFTAGSVSAEISPELLGVGYIIGPRIAVDHVRRRRARLPGAHPGDQVLRRRPPPGRSRPAPMPDQPRCRPDEIRSAYVLYIGAGAVAAGGIISLLRSLPTIWHGLREGLQGPRAAARGARRPWPRTDRDLSDEGRARSACLALIVAIIAGAAAAHEPRSARSSSSSSASCSSPSPRG